MNCSSQSGDKQISHSPSERRIGISIMEGSHGSNGPRQGCESPGIVCCSRGRRKSMGPGEEEIDEY